MKEVREIESGLYHIISKPGDATRYDYMMLVNYGQYCFMPVSSPFVYPQRLDYNQVEKFGDEEMSLLAGEEGCNFYTLKECIRSMKEHRAGILMD